MRQQDELLTLQDIASFLKVSIHTTYRNWKKWDIKPVVPYPNAKPRFWKSDLIRLLEKAK